MIRGLDMLAATGATDGNSLVAPVVCFGIGVLWMLLFWVRR